MELLWEARRMILWTIKGIKSTTVKGLPMNRYFSDTHLLILYFACCSLVIQQMLSLLDNGAMLVYKVDIIFDLLKLYSSQAEGNSIWWIKSLFK